MKTAVALIIFNRPATMERVVAEITKARPSRLLVIADGPRRERAGEAEQCASARAVIDRVDWECEVLKNYSDMNLGCGQRVSTGIEWVFEHVEAAIILEDDCVPDQSFFRFCEELLERYRDDELVMMIGGSNDWFERIRPRYSYHFSRHPWIWGWATWRRAWRHFDMGISLWPELRETSWLRDVLEERLLVEEWQGLFDRIFAAGGDVDIWGHQWEFACWAHSGLSIFPNTNLVRNIGWGDGATHTKSWNPELGDLRTFEVKFPLEHPPCVLVDMAVDRCRSEMGRSRVARRRSTYGRIRRWPISRWVVRRVRELGVGRVGTFGRGVGGKSNAAEQAGVRDS